MPDMRQPAQARSRRSHRRLHGRLESGRRHSHLALGSASVPQPLQEFRIHHRQGRRCGGSEQIGALRAALERALAFYVNYCHANGLAARACYSLGTDRVDELVKLAQETQREFSNCVFFTSKLVFRNENWVTRLLHNQTALALQRKLHLNGMQMVILPMQL